MVNVPCEFERNVFSAVVGWSLVQFSSVAKSCPTHCNPMNRNTPGLPVHHQLPESTRTHVHWVGDAIQPSHLLSSASPPTLNLSQHQSLFQWVSSSHQVAKASASVLPMNTQDWSPLGWTGWISLQSKGLSRVFSNTTVQLHPVDWWWCWVQLCPYWFSLSCICPFLTDRAWDVQLKIVDSYISLCNFGV